MARDHVRGKRPEKKSGGGSKKKRPKAKTRRVIFLMGPSGSSENSGLGFRGGGGEKGKAFGTGLQGK